MKKKRKIDFIIHQVEDERLIFRFYPRQSSCHSFNEVPPTKPEEIYKVYYSYAVIKQWKFNPEDQWKSEIMFYEHCDECSIIEEIGERCLLLSDGYETFERKDGERIPFLNQKVIPFGMGTEWTISKRTCMEYDFENKKDIKRIYYTFTLFDYNNKGFRFVVKEDSIKTFGEYLLGCCDYMLIHGDPI